MVSFLRNGKNIELNTFSSKEVVQYLKEELHKEEFKVLAIPKWCHGILASINGTSFIIYAKFSTYIELSYNSDDIGNISKVIEAIKRWEQFTKTEEKFYVDFEDKETNTHTTIFENGYASSKAYSSRFEKYKLTITKF